MLYTEHELATELAAQLSKTDLGVTEAREHEVEDGRDVIPAHGVLLRLDNGQEFFLIAEFWGGPRPE